MWWQEHNWRLGQTKHLCLLTVGSWVLYLTSLTLSFPVCKMPFMLPSTEILVGIG